MNDAIQKWLAERAWMPEALGCALRQRDGNVICRSLHETCPAEMIEKVVGHYDTLATAALVASRAPSWSTWSFEQGHVRFVERSDGWRLAVIVRAGSETALALDSVSSEFLALQLDV